MTYDPMRYSLAKANVIGNTVQGVNNTLVDAASKIGELAKQKDINEKVKRSYVDILNKFADEAVATSPGITREKALITARKIYHPPIDGFSAEDNLKNLLAGDSSAQKVLDGYRTEAQKLKEKTDLETKKQRGATAAQQAASTPVRGFDMTGDLSMGPPAPTERAPYQEEAMAQYGAGITEGRYQPQTTEELRNQPSISALEKRPEPEKPLTTYQKWVMKNKEDSAKIDDIKETRKLGKDSSINRDKNVETLMKLETDYLAGAKSGAARASSLKAAIINLKTKIASNSASILDDKVEEKLRTIGQYEGPTDLQSLESELGQINNIINKSKAEAKRFGAMAKEVADGSTLSGAYLEKGSDKNKYQEEVRVDNAIDYIQTNIKPTMSVLNGSVRQLIQQLPPEHRGVITQKVAQLKGKIPDSEILRMLLAGKRQ